MKLPSHVKLHLTKHPQGSLDRVVENGREAMHLMTRAVMERSPASDDDSGSLDKSSCGSGDDRAVCEKPTGASSQTLPIVLGVVIPVVCCIVACIVLHRKYVRRQRAEDSKDPHKSLDFGTDVPKNGKGKPVPEMTVTDLGEDPMNPRRQRGMSMNMGSPYLLPGGLDTSRASIHSMSRSMRDEHDPYRPVAMIRSSTDGSGRQRMGDNGSVYSASTNHSGQEKSGLLRNAQRMSRSMPMRSDPMSPQSSQSSEELPLRPMHSNNGRSMPSSRKTSLGSESPLPDIQEHQIPQRKQSLPESPPVPEPPIEAMPLPPRTTSAAAPAETPAPVLERQSAASVGGRAGVTSMASEGSRYSADQPVVPSIQIPTVQEPEEMPYDVDPAMISTGRLSLDQPLQQLEVAQPAPQRVSMMGLRPLPPDHPEENPEMRANRIRSFYKEYFDDSRPNPVQASYQEEFDPTLMEGAIYDPETGGFFMPTRPFAEGPQRRAMTPPPGGARRMMGGAPHQRRMSTLSAGQGPFRGRGPPPPMPQKKLPPPKPLQGLPTPHKLSDFDSVISSPIDFAPPSSFRSRQNSSRPESPLGGEFPYAPAVRAFSPLASSHDDLAALPSPHLLRKSGTFTSLDFAPPTFPRQRGDGASDNGSIGSGRSGISHMQRDAVRAGAYRVSRIPKEVVMTRDDMSAQLKPKMNLISPA
ncbi:hypothetical protein KC343_g1993 [Hortaea werneckii]|nr:hypothetical protein KC343_g1993 [Hortaea werneckii]